MPKTVAVFQKTQNTIKCLTPADDAGLNEAITATLKKLDPEQFPNGRIEVREDGTLFVEGRYFAPEWCDETLLVLRKQYDEANHISPSDRILLPGRLKSEIVNSGRVVF